MVRQPLGVLTLATLASFALAACGAKTTTEHRDGEAAAAADADARTDAQARLAAQPGATAQLRVLETTDLHVNMEAFDYYRNVPTLNSGLVRAGTVLRAARAEVKNSVTIDNGDLLQGTPLGDWFHQNRDPKKDLHTVFKAMNLLGYDAANIGNHDFNYGLDFLEAALQGAKFPYVSANVVKAGSDLQHYQGFDPANGQSAGVLPYVILTRTITADDGTTDTVKIGVLGLVTPQIMMWDHDNLNGKVDSEDIVATAQLMVPRMRADGADVVIVVPHSGISAAPAQDKQENAVYYLAAVPGIDAILCGHSHLVFPSSTYADIPNADLTKGLLRGVPTVMAGFWGSHVGVVDLALKKAADGWHVTGGTATAREVQTILKPTDFEKDLRDAVADDHAATIQYLQKPVGSASTEIDSYFALATPSLAVEIVQLAQIWDIQKLIAQGGDTNAALKGLPLLSASAPYKSGANAQDYSDVAAGPVTLRNVADLYVYPNTVQVVKVPGQTVLEWLEMSASAFNQIKPTGDKQDLWGGAPGYNFDTILGLSYVIDLSQPARYDAKTGKQLNAAAHRVSNVIYHNAVMSDGAANPNEGKPLDLTKDHLVITNNYRANGGGHFPTLDNSNGSYVVFSPGQDSRQVVGDYFVAKTAQTLPIDAPLDSHWLLKPVAGATDVLVHTASTAQKLTAETHGLIQYVQDDASGFASYKLIWPTLTPSPSPTPAH